MPLGQAEENQDDVYVCLERGSIADPHGEEIQETLEFFASTYPKKSQGDQVPPQDS